MSPPSSEEAARAVNVALLRKGAWALAVTAVLLVVACGAAQGWDGALGALLGTVLVVAFFGVDVAVYLRPVNIGTPTATLVVMLYVFKLITFGLLVLLLAAVVPFDHACFAISVVVEALVAAAAAVVIFSRMRVPYVEP